MDLYSILKNFLFLFPPEFTHDLAIKMLQYGLIPSTSGYSHPILSNNVFNLHFENPIGLAAGFDKNAQCVSSLFKQNFGFIEVGTVTLKPQLGNSKPRIFRLTCDKAIINSLGFNSKGSVYLYNNLKNISDRSQKILGVNIGKNKDTHDYIEDYIYLIKKFYNLADYITLNISSPNTSNLRDLQKKKYLHSLLHTLSELRVSLNNAYNRYVPLLVKISPDLDAMERENIADLCLLHKIDGLITSNTTSFCRDSLRNNYRQKIGGLSGAPLRKSADFTLSEMYRLTDGKIPIIGVGGIFNAEHVYNKICLGASLIQIYTSIIYDGFSVVNRIKQDLASLLKQSGFVNIKDAIGIAHR